MSDRRGAAPLAGGPSPVGAGSGTDLRNHEAASYLGRSLVAALPSLALSAASIGLALGAILSHATGPELLWVAVPVGLVLVALAGVGAWEVRRLTPAQLRLDPDGFLAEWGPPTARREYVPWSRVAAVDVPSWRWAYASRSLYLQYSPGEVRFDRLGDSSGSGSVGEDDRTGVFYLARPNVARLRGALDEFRQRPSRGADPPIPGGGPQTMTEAEAAQLGEV